MSGRTGTWLVAVAVAALAAAAVLDALVTSRSDGDATAPPPPASATVSEARVDAFLAAERVVGRLLYVDEGCHVRTLELPSGARSGAPGVAACRFTSSPGGIVGVDGAVVAPRPGARPSESPVAALCAGDHVDLHALSGDETDPPLLGRALERVHGCAPAWRPDGSLTVVREGEVVDVGMRATRVGRTVLSRRDLARAFGRSPWNLERPFVREAAWLDNDLVAAVVRAAGAGGDLLALFRDGRLVATTPSPYDELSALRVSPRGTYVAARIGDANALVLLDRTGEFVPVGLRGHTITWSLDEVWAAVAAPDGIYVFETGGRASRFGRVPIRALDVLWR